MTSSPTFVHVDGRAVAVYTLAEGANQRTVVFSHIAPGAGTFDPDPERTQAYGITLLGVDRPGYGASDPFPQGTWPSVAAAADDIAAILGERGDGPFGAAGWSAGGRVALALAARHPDLVDRVAVIGTPAPNEAVRWIPDEYAQGFDALRAMPPDAAIAALLEQLAPTVPSDTDSSEALAGLGFGPADESIMNQLGLNQRLGTMTRAAFAQGAIGVAQDLAAYCLQPWGFEPADVRAKVLLLYAADDPIAGPAHGEWWRTNLPHAHLEIVPNAGHMLVVPAWERVLAHVSSTAQHHE